jgi:hypothetical protein
MFLPRTPDPNPNRNPNPNRLFCRVGAAGSASGDQQEKPDEDYD